MLNIKFIVSFLEENQKNIDKSFYKKLNNYELINNELNNNSQIEVINSKYNKKLPLSFENFFKNINIFYFDNKNYKNRSNIFSFINSILLIGNEYFILLQEDELLKEVKKFIKMIDDDLFEKNLYNKFDYVKNRKFNKEDIQEVLKNAYLFNSNENFHLLKQYIADYLGINLFIFHLIDGEIINYDLNEKYLTRQFGDNYNKYIPTFCLIYDKEIYRPILINNYKYKNSDNSSIFTYSLHENEIENLFEYFKIDMNLNMEENKDANNKEINGTIIDIKNIKLDKLNKLKIDEIKTICIQNNISIQKKSDKTLKMINKLKTELIEELINLKNKTKI